MKRLSLITATGLALLLAQSAPTTQASPSVRKPQAIATAKVCEQLAEMRRSANKGVDQRAKLMNEVRKSPRKSTVGEALREFYPGGKATLSDPNHPDNQVVFISTSLEKGESLAISKPHSSPSQNCPDMFPDTLYTLVKSVSTGKGQSFIQKYEVIHLP
jgi:hypothetical protein